LLANHSLQSRHGIAFVLPQRFKRSGHAHRLTAPLAHAQTRCEHGQHDDANNTETTKGSVGLRRQAGDERAEDEPTQESSDMSSIVDTREDSSEKQVESRKEQ